jgi:hypothetical protein
MTPPAPRTSARLRRAAAAERTDLDRHRARLRADRERLQAQLDRIDAGLAEINERCGLLDRLAPAEPAPAQPQSAQATAPTRAHGDGGGQVLRGPAIREKAVQVLRDRGVDALHYRDWHALVAEAGFAVAGKDPRAVFLTQISRSPVIRRSTQSGVYELDRDAPARLRSELDRLQEQLRELTSASAAPADLSAIRERRAQLLSEIEQTEKALEEAERALSPKSAASRPVAVAG